MKRIECAAYGAHKPNGDRDDVQHPREERTDVNANACAMDVQGHATVAVTSEVPVPISLVFRFGSAPARKISSSCNTRAHQMPYECHRAQGMNLTDSSNHVDKGYEMIEMVKIKARVARTTST